MCNQSMVKRVVFSLFVLAIIAWQYAQQRNVAVHYLNQDGKEHVLVLPNKDKKRLFRFMVKLFAEDHFAYTLLGPKPVSWATYRTPLPFNTCSTVFDAFNKYHCTLRRGWKTWEKYRHLFPGETFFAEPSPRHPNSVSILLVNKERFNDVVLENKKDFEEVLERKIGDGWQLLNEIDHRSLMDEVLKGHQALLGIVLGYGRDNAWRFLETSKQRIPLDWVWDEASYWTEAERATTKWNSAIECCLTLYSCPSFVGIPASAESLKLKEEYLQTKQKVLKYYKDKDFLEATLSLLAGYRED